ncbi:MAG: quinolinate synthase NadA [Candidatus Eisenbacteria bacterium]
MDAEYLRERIGELKRDRDAVILAHNYQLGEVQDIADHVGDSLELSRIAAQSPAGVIVFCGVHFMAETAAILAPGKTVLLPVLDADCPMARMADADALRRMKVRHPGAVVVCYVNTTAEVKAECDVCCTSANAEKIVSQIPEDSEILFVPDRNLGHYVGARTGRRMLLWPGHCPPHARIRPADILAKKRIFPAAEVIVHPECSAAVIALADAVLSTGGMVRHARASRAREIIVGTEIGMIHRLQRENPATFFIAASEQAVCPNMKKITLTNVLQALERLQYRIEVPAEIARRAEQAVNRMIAVSG